MTYTITNILNNSALTAVDSSGKEYVFIGRGISFGKHAKDYVDESKIERQFGHSDDNRLNHHIVELIDEIPDNYFDMANVAIRYASKKLQIQFSASTYVGMADHINSAIERYQEDINLTFSFLTEVNTFYPSEYKVAEWIVDFINAQLDVDLPEDEVGFIAMHLINANGDDFQKLSQVKKVLEITAYVSNKVLELLPGIDKQTLEYSRFLIHLKYFSIRYLADKQYNEVEVNISLKSDKTLVLNQVIEEVSQVLKDKYGQHLNKYEKSYLLLHLNRIIK